MRTLECLTLCLCASVASHALATELGRLFYTPEQRQQLERSTRSTLASPVLNGIVQRQGGQRTVWLNGQAKLHPSNSYLDSQPLALPDQPPVRVKVGERVP